MEAMRRLIDGLRAFERVITAVAYIIVAGLLIGDVLARELFATSFLGAQKIAVLAAVTAAFAGFAMVTHDDAHLRISGVDALVPARWGGLHKRIGDLLSFALCVGLAVAAAMFVRDSISSDEQVAVLYIPTWPFQLALVYAFASSAVRYLAFVAFPALKPAPSEGGH